MPETSKAAIRQRLRVARSSLRGSITLDKSKRMTENLLNANLLPASPCLETPCLIAGYWPVRGEIDCRPLLQTLDDRGFSCLLPVIEKPHSPLIFRPWKPGNPMEQGIFAIPIPPPSLPARIPDIVLVPLLGFDRQGMRLGYGGGYYDRTLARLRSERSDIRAIGIAYAVQEVASLPAKKHDQPLDAVVTEKEVLYIRPNLKGPNKKGPNLEGPNLKGPNLEGKTAYPRSSTDPL